MLNKRIDQAECGCTNVVRALANKVGTNLGIIIHVLLLVRHLTIHANLARQDQAKNLMLKSFNCLLRLEHRRELRFCIFFQNQIAWFCFLRPHYFNIRFMVLMEYQQKMFKNMHNYSHDFRWIMAFHWDSIFIRNYVKL